MYVFMYVCMYPYTYVCKYISMNYMYVRMCIVHMYTCMPVHMYTCMYVCMSHFINYITHTLSLSDDG